MYGITECTESKKKCTELYGMKIGVLSVQKYVRMYGILEKGIFKLKIFFQFTQLQGCFLLFRHISFHEFDFIQD